MNENNSDTANKDNRLPWAHKKVERNLPVKQGVVCSKVPARKKARNIFTYMDTISKENGPKSLLTKSIQQNRRIKVWTRSHSYVRSICTGYLVAFDRFWNLAMIDVDEIYRVPTKKQGQTSNIINTLTEELGQVSIKAKENGDNESAELNKEIETNLNLYKSGKFNIYQRHVNQILLRGDNVVFVVLAD